MWWKEKIKYKTAFSVQSDLDIRRLRELMKTVAGKELKKKKRGICHKGHLYSTNDGFKRPLQNPCIRFFYYPIRTFVRRSP